jgi:hypothetical protein
MRYKPFLILSAFILCFSCTQDLLDDAGKKLIYPVNVSPTVISFNDERSLTIQWPKDDACDEYLLYKDELATGSFSNLIYRGTDLKFVDNDIKLIGSNYIYSYYKLAKKMGKKQFDKSSYSYGVAGNFKKDDFEDNNERNSAAELKENTVANIYYYKDLYGNETEDIDWYYITLDPQFYALIQFTDFNNIGPQQIRYAQEGKDYSPVTVNDYFTIYNYSTMKRTFYFQVFVSKSDFGNKMGDYKIIIVREEKF